MKFILYFVAIVLLCQLAMADIFSQLQFMKIVSPTNGQSISAGEEVTIKYVMQPLILSKIIVVIVSIFKIYTHCITFFVDQVSNGYTKNLDINFHKRSGNTKQALLKSICKNW